jgi:hypothetical protein
MTELADLRDKAKRDTDRWLRELRSGQPRNTLSLGMIQESCRYAEELLRKAALVFTRSDEKLLISGLEKVTAGKKRSIDRLTFGECLNLLVFVDGELNRKRLISKHDRSFLDKLSRARNTFVHGSPGSYPDESQIAKLLEDVRALCALSIIEAAVSLDAPA